MRKKILIFNGYYLPAQNYGGPLTSIRNAVSTCSDTFEFYIIAANHDLGSDEKFKDINEGWNVVEKANVLYVQDGFFDYSPKKINLLINEVQPDLIWFTGILRPEIKICTMLLCRKSHIPVLFSPRGEVSLDRVRIKSYKKIPYLYLISKLGIYKNAWFHITSDDEYEGVKKLLNVKDERITMVKNIPIAIYEKKRNYIKKENQLNVIFLSRIHMLKNLDYAIKAISRINGEVKFDIYGPKENIQYWNLCEELIEQAPDNVKIKYCGVADTANVSKIFNKYDCLLLPTLNENYGHVIAESLSVGCPVILSKGTTPWDDLDNIAGYVCDLDKIQEFEDALNKIMQLNRDDYDALSIKTIAYYKKKLEEDSAVQGHLNMFENIIDKYSEILEM